MNFELGRKCAENTAQCADQVLHFELGGLHLQEPMALVTNLMIAITCFICFFKLKKHRNVRFTNTWRIFFLIFGISTVFGGLGHLFFVYFGTPGKFPCWISGFVSSFIASTAFYEVDIVKDKTRKNLRVFLIVKTLVLLTMALVMQNFIFIIIDSAITYLFIGGAMSIKYLKNGINSFKANLIAIGLLIPPVFIFLLKLSPHDWFNKDDLSHMFMIGTIIFLYIGAKKFAEQYPERSI